mmetsp:Transcript_10306/g.35869  ORF Transcript_10306/g.35869 Transcript_10306/m.35869 type:complete len:263 (+) Transcript_10306:2291-3079(+)
MVPVLEVLSHLQRSKRPRALQEQLLSPCVVRLGHQEHDMSGDEVLVLQRHDFLQCEHHARVAEITIAAHSELNLEELHRRLRQLLVARVVGERGGALPGILEPQEPQILHELLATGLAERERALVSLLVDKRGEHLQREALQAALRRLAADVAPVEVDGRQLPGPLLAACGLQLCPCHRDSRVHEQVEVLRVHQHEGVGVRLVPHRALQLRLRPREPDYLVVHRAIEESVGVGVHKYKPGALGVGVHGNNPALVVTELVDRH